MDELLDDELLQEFITETREHLYSIENDLLSIEEQGENVDLELVNKVFRAAHSIKGGSGFFGLDKVKELAHRAETVLDMLRSGKMVPNSEITNVLLAAFDQLREMVNMPGDSRNADISELLQSLNALASSYLSSAEKDSLHNETVLKGESEKSPEISLPQVDIDRSERMGQNIYRLSIDLIHDIEHQGMTVLDLFNKLWDQGELLDSALDFAAVGSLEDEIANQLPMQLVYSTSLDARQVAELFSIDDERLERLSSNPQEEPVAETVTETFEVENNVAENDLDAAGQEKANVGLSKPPGSEINKQEKPDKSVEASSSAVTKVEETLRVSVPLLEKLMNLAGELVLGRNQLRAAIASNNDLALTKADQHLNQVTTELQDAIMQTRLQPIGHLFGKFPRVVRDMARTLGKDIQVDIRGKDVELDRSLIEGLSDPLTHMIRNAVDHGLEIPGERIESGKPTAGTLIISASHEAGQVVIEISDDGRGMDPEKIAHSALKKGQIREEKLAGMSDQEKLELILMPGFSTAEQVSEFSGRGVGMDVVKTNLNKLGGQVEISSTVGKGTRFRIKLPLTLAIIPSLIISLENERFAIPQVNVEELIRIRAEEVKNRVEIVGGSEVLLLRDKTLPLVRFDEFLGIVPSYVDPQTGRREVDRRLSLADRRSSRYDLNSVIPQQTSAESQLHTLNKRGDGRRHTPDSALEVAIVSSNGTRYGLVVDGFQDTEEIVVKPLGRHLEGLNEYAGATILGDGSVALIIDTAGLAEKVELMSAAGSQRAAELKQDAERKRLENQHALLMFHNASDEQCAISLDNVLRIERIHHDQIEMHGQRRTMQYRGASLPLVTMADTARVKEIEQDQELVVIVSKIKGNEIGLLGAMPVDVIERCVEIDTVTHRTPGILGSTIVDDTTVLIADIYELVDTVNPSWGVASRPELLRFDTGSNADEGGPDTVNASHQIDAVTLLLAEDSDFFRNQVKRHLESAGYRVLACPDGQAAWEQLLDNLGQVRLVVTDIEMPRLSGLELTRNIRGDEKTKSLPVIAVSSLAGDDDRERGMQCGVTEYQVKLDRDALLEAVERLLEESVAH
ncbi:MAG: chemotaxis protein CheW [Desulfuromonadales bacterium]|nr:chemotaxis protein CheW [Desulfuromonadales bacterium]MBN2791561.1 chemotaxis protein CheW [Desulfuromonadales bacterium]